MFPRAQVKKSLSHASPNSSPGLKSPGRHKPLQPLRFWIVLCVES